MSTLPDWAVKSGEALLIFHKEVWKKARGEDPPEEKEREKEIVEEMAGLIYKNYTLNGESDREQDLRVQLERTEGELGMLQALEESGRTARDALVKTCERLGAQLEEARKGDIGAPQKKSNDK